MRVRPAHKHLVALASAILRRERGREPRVGEIVRATHLSARKVREILGKLPAPRDERGALLRTMPYRDYLLTPEWLTRRAEALARANYRCQVCNRAEGELNVHHRTYERRGYEHPDDLVVLCRPCHALFHGRGVHERS